MFELVCILGIVFGNVSIRYLLGETNRLLGKSLCLKFRYYMIQIQIGRRVDVSVIWSWWKEKMCSLSFPFAEVKFF